MIVNHDLAIIRFLPSDRHRHVEVSPRVTPQSHDCAISFQASDLHLTRSTACISHVLLMMIGWTSVHLIDARHVDTIASNVLGAATSPAKERFHGNIDPHGIKTGNGEYIRPGGLTLLRYYPNPITRAH